MKELRLNLYWKERNNSRLCHLFNRKDGKVSNLDELSDHAEKVLRHYGCRQNTALRVYLNGPSMLYTALLAAVRKIGCSLEVGVFVPTEVYFDAESGYHHIYDVPYLPECEKTETVQYDVILRAGRRAPFGCDESSAYEVMWDMSGPKKEEFAPKSECSKRKYERLAWNPVSHPTDEAEKDAEENAKKYAGKSVLLLADCFYAELVISINALVKQGCKISMMHYNEDGEPIYYRLT